MTYTFLDPMARDYRGRENEPGIAAQIVAGDMEDIRNSDLVLVNAPTPSVGTSMEVFYAKHTLRKLVLTVCPNPRPSPWLVTFSTWVVPTVEDAVARIRYQYESLDDTVTIYLAGPINGCTDAQAIDWRESVKLSLISGPNKRAPSS